jgi:hypothetical protein
MARTPASLRALLTNLPTADARWRPPSGAWSILEILCHLCDEEVDDFRTRVESTLRDPAAAWNPIDPEGAARERRYNEQDPGAALARFEAERAKSIAWLRSLRSPDWTRAHTHAKIGFPLSAADLLASWAAHDALHIRQIAKRLYELAQRDGGPGVSVKYAGEWGA